MTISKLESSIPANNQKIIELYNKIRKEELDPSPHYQRKLVWRKQHKFNFISTILLNFPFPEIYIAPGSLDTETLSLRDQIVDGQQRLTTITNYIEGKDVFSLNRISIKKFAELDKTEKENFLNYEVSVRYLKNADEDQIKEIFQRINSTEYSLNKSERLNAQWGDSEFICFAKQIIESDIDEEIQIMFYKIKTENRKYFLSFFHEKYSVFSDNDISRMLALQYMLTLIATICQGEYFRRNELVQAYIEKYNEDFSEAGIIEENLIETLKFIEELNLPKKSYWFNKANLYTIIVELYKFDVSKVDKKLLCEKLEKFEISYRDYQLEDFKESSQPIRMNLIDTNIFHKPIVYKSMSYIPADYIKYFSYAKEAVNEKYARDFRGGIVKKFIEESLITEAH